MKKAFNIRIQLYFLKDPSPAKETINEVLQSNGLTGKWNPLKPEIIIRGVEPLTLLSVIEAVLKMKIGFNISCYEKKYETDRS